MKTENMYYNQQKCSGVKEAAVQLGYSRKTITNRKKAVLQKLRKILEKV